MVFFDREFSRDLEVAILMIFVIDFPSVKFIIFTFDWLIFFIFNFIFFSDTMAPPFIEKILFHGHIFFINPFRDSIGGFWNNGFDKK